MYQEALTEAMTWLGQQPDIIFVGQAVAYPGNAMYGTLSGVPMEKRLELPVMEDAQLGMSIGMALAGKTVITIYPRFDFLLLAMNQLVNHLDHLEDFTHGQFHARVLIRVGIGSTNPLHPGIQHCSDYTLAFKKLLNHINIIKLESPELVVPMYKHAYGEARSSLLIEEMDKYGVV